MADMKDTIKRLMLAGASTNEITRMVADLHETDNRRVQQAIREIEVEKARLK